MEAHFYSLLRKSHAIWKVKYPKFKPTKKQIAQLDQLDDLEKEKQFAVLEQVFNEPYATRERIKQQIRDILAKIKEKENRKNSREGMVAEEARIGAWSAKEDREKIRNKARAIVLNRAAREEQLNAEVQKQNLAVSKELATVLPQLGLYFAFKNLATVDQFIPKSKKKEELQEIRHHIVDSIFDFSQNLKRPLESPTYPDRKKYKEQQEEAEESEESEEAEEDSDNQ